jgi:uncharacterized oligopeptide transporter (OPT) family protein
MPEVMKSEAGEVEVTAGVVPPVDFITPQLTWRAIGTGMLLGGTLSICNVYTGLKIGWGLNMSITGILLAFGFWYALSRGTGGRVRMMNKPRTTSTRRRARRRGR